MSFYNLQLDRKSTKTHWRSPKQRRNYLCIHGNASKTNCLTTSQGRVVFSTDSHLEGSTDPVYGTRSLYDSKGRSVGSIRYKNSAIEIAADGTSSVKTTGTEIYRTSTEYDSFGNQISRTLPLGFGADGILGTADDDILPEGDFTERSEYDGNGRVIKQIS
ncbi:MAG: hypothetical protein LBB34_03990, partial [Holosporales bacterium]|nr:hypothetical protein [Holosporales bacterium]